MRGIILDGFGTHTFKDGSYFIGDWKDGEKDGNGTIYFKTGSIKVTGTWDDGKLKFIVE